MKISRTYAPRTLSALSTLGQQITVERRRRGWTQAALAERAGVSPTTLLSIEKGSPKAAIGTVFEVAGLLGIPLVGASDPAARQMLEERLAILPQRVHQPKTEFDDDF
ncbi:helix-turn-helix transcriptional regulator [uncultured Arthrobacter sp.]|uniref:helix-turn-helix transcriptional regulator n=1 Tax=uncultured Arthrobacter sp. TaxID=114050 RepID=UPI002618F09A|nr:helix-turn-helix domain-containing protein [uncultured Arthrobacter sp.]